MNTKGVYALNGQWNIDYLSAEPYTGQQEPELTADAGVVPVPGYWEDLLDQFRKTPLHTKLHWNPLYTQQRYPQTGYVPDMALPAAVGCFVYRRQVTLPQVPVVQRTELWFGGVQNTVSAWVNGVYLGRHEGYSAAFAFEIPAGILVAGQNTVTLAVSNTRLKGYKGRPVSGLTSRAANECTGGIYGDVELRFLQAGLRQAWVTTAEDLSAITVHTEGAASFERQVEIFDSGKLLATAIIPIGQSKVELPAAGLELWCHNNPKLYTATVTAGGQKECCRFGVRRLSALGTKLYFNGQPYFFRGVCEHCYHPITVHPTRDKNHYRKVIKTMKSLGFNSIRFHTHVPAAEYLEAADELGILIEVETPNNTTFAEWQDIVRLTRQHTSAVMFSSGNEMVIDEDYIEHLRACAELVHSDTDALFSPMSAMRGIEYFSFGKGEVQTPFRHDPERLAALGEFCDVYNSYSLGATSYYSDTGDARVLDTRNAVYGKPLLSHEICIHGTYADLSLKDRYKGTRIGDTELFTSVERHLAEKGLLDRAPTYYRNSVGWQSLLRKQCFELTRRSHTMAGYDFLGDIDTHWHTFGYCVGMMNEFYELKPGETRENVLRYNADTVLLADLPYSRNFTAGQRVEVPILVSNYGAALPKATLNLRVSDGQKVLLRRELRLSDLPAGCVKELYRLGFTLPKVTRPCRLTVCANLTGGNTDTENRWELYVFPKAGQMPSAKACRQVGLTVTKDISAEELMQKMQAGQRVLLFGTGPFTSVATTFQLSVAGRTNGHLATVIAEHPITNALPHDGYCGWQFRQMLNGGASVVLDCPELPFAPVIEMVSTYKNARREALVFEYQIGGGKLLVCSLHLQEDDPGAMWLRQALVQYAAGADFVPAVQIRYADLTRLCGVAAVEEGANDNEAANKNDITM